MSCVPHVLGSQTPRIWTPPLRDLTQREASYGYDLIDFAIEIGWPLDPWECWAAIHMGELLADGRPRFRMVLILVARQNGKTTLCRVLTLYWLFIERSPFVLGTSTDRDTARYSWHRVIDMARDVDMLADLIGPWAVRETVGQELFTTLDGCEYKFAAPNRRAGRSYTVRNVVLDELREHKTWDVYKAAVKAMTAVSDAQCVAITNQGEAGAVVLDSLRDSAIEFIETGVGDPRLFLGEWSSPSDADPTDPAALAQANPQLGTRIELDSLMGEAIRAKRAGGEELAGFKTESMCIRVTLLDPAIDPDKWRSCASSPDQTPDLGQHRDRLALCLDVSLDGTHATLVAAATLEDGFTHVEVIKVWKGFGATQQLRHDLPALVTKLRPRSLGWFPDGPAAAVAAGLAERRGTWPPRRVTVEELKADVPAVCMGLAEQVGSLEIRHPDDPVLNLHVAATQKLNRGESLWLYTRAGVSPIDATYALAGAVHLARTLPPALPPLVVL